jgi:hypothetical protein
MIRSNPPPPAEDAQMDQKDSENAVASSEQKERQPACPSTLKSLLLDTGNRSRNMLECLPHQMSELLKETATLRESASASTTVHY